MKEAIVQPDLSVKIIDSPIPTAGEHQVVIKVAVSGTNPKDWKIPQLSNKELNSGDDIAGTVHTVGDKVYAFKPGDRVAAFHEMMTPHGSFAEYALAWEHTTFHLPQHISFEEAATIPLAAMTAALGLFADLKVPQPWSPNAPGKQEGVKLPLLVYGASSATGAFAAQLARLAGVRPIIGVAGRNQELANTVADYVIDYRQGEDAVVKGIEDALQKEGLGNKLKLVFDGVSENGSHAAIARVVDPDGGLVSHVLPPERFAKGVKYPDGATAITTLVAQAHKENKDFAFVWFNFFARALDDGRFKPHPHEVVPGGLEGVATGLKKLRDGKASGVKYVYRISDTSGAGEESKI